MLEYIKLMFLSMVPIIELRGAIPLGIAMKLNPVYVYIFSLIGSTLIAIPIVILFRNIIDYLRHKKYFNKIIRWIDRQIEGKAKKLKAVSIIGIILFVGVPLPTTGSWSAAALASIFKMRIRDALIGIFIGNSIAGIIMCAISLHLADNFKITSAIILSVVIITAIIIYYFYKKKKISAQKNQKANEITNN